MMFLWRIPSVPSTCRMCRRCEKKIFSIQRNSRIISPHSKSTRNLFTSLRLQAKLEKIDLLQFPADLIRNFSIIAHVDHGKSTLADRLLEITGTISSNTKNEQVLDKLQVERERGITVKAQTASLFYKYKGQTYLLNLVDTPGHVDFNYEVSRSLRACEGVILLVDANQGVQAQTVANFFLAFEADLTILPVLNKIDLPGADVETVQKQMKNVFDIEPDEILQVSAKHGTGVEDVLKAVIDRIPPPTTDIKKPFKGLVFDSTYEKFKGAVTNVSVKDGVVKKGDKIVSAHTKKSYEVQDVGILYPEQTSTGCLYGGQVGYMMANIKSMTDVWIGDTLYHEKSPVEALPGFKPAKPMVFAGTYPMDQSEYQALKMALEKLTMNDPSVSVSNDNSEALGVGFRLGFLGLLHMDVFNQRLEQEYDASVIPTAPNVSYKVKIKGDKNIKFYGAEEITILNPCKLPDPNIIEAQYEPMVYSTIIVPVDYIGDINPLCMERRGEILDQSYIDDTRIMFKVIFPLNEILIDFYDELKSVSSGYASFDYEDHGYQESDLVKIIYLLNGKELDELTMISHITKARQKGREIVEKLCKSIPRQLFKVSVQACVGGKVLAREDIQPYRKDVTAKCYGGDITRKNKLLKRQAEGKKKMRMIGKISVPKDVFIKVLTK
ncbi:translation factor Guf1, mitochondrial-like isoform X4 [Mytilus californianus]|uniref:translation factor Guf1, mitochondrial-like isoform X2 n=1 Tax=Mytilus californianus TaxID=6549 RepID=UPI002247DC51|nr:translation factor Guf1, mitochondrial-like isoform X2 [Mytilus californianus]XP_052077455.1 translation factor Guf1, mitochondrial-like isoform X3 [Mytilus californianus]XP_052077456.1 translation factor Guf1, mitochondrial-like isoform X4 [Mytilus californianus]